MAQTSSDPVTRLVALIEGGEEWGRISDAWRMTNSERKHGVFLIERRDSLHRLEDYQVLNVQQIFFVYLNTTADGISTLNPNSICSYARRQNPL